MDWQPIETIPTDNSRVLLWVSGKMLPGVRFGWAYKCGDGFRVKPEGANGDWNSDVTHWAPLPPPPHQRAE